MIEANLVYLDNFNIRYNIFIHLFLDNNLCDLLEIIDDGKLLCNLSKIQRTVSLL